MFPHPLSIMSPHIKETWSCSGIAITGNHYASSVTIPGKKDSKDLEFSWGAINPEYRSIHCITGINSHADI